METNTTTLYSLAAIYIALTEAITATFGRSVEPLANRLIGDMLTQMPPEAANVCAQLIKHARTNMPSELISVTEKELLH